MINKRMEIQDLPDFGLVGDQFRKYSIEEDSGSEDDDIFETPSRYISSNTDIQKSQPKEVSIQKRIRSPTNIIKMCSELIDEKVNIETVRKRCIELEKFDDPDFDDMFKLIGGDHIISVLGLIESSYIPTQPTIYAVSGKELALLLELETEALEETGAEYFKSKPLLYSISYNHVKYDKGGIARKKEFFGNACRQIACLFDFVNPNVPSPRMYISIEPDSVIISRLNAISKHTFSEKDLPLLYMIAGELCGHATISRYSTGIAFSRVLTSIMVSEDIGIDKESLRTIYMLEVFKGNEDDLDVKQHMYETYMFENIPDKKIYLENFLRGFYIHKSLAKYGVTYNELHDIIGGGIFSKGDHEKWWDGSVRFPNTSFKQKFMDYIFSNDAVIVNYIKSYNSDFGDLQAREYFYTTLLWKMTGALHPSGYIKAHVKTSDVETIRFQSYDNVIEINPGWFKEVDIVTWMSQITKAFSEK